jgi:hypothetical protein
MRSWKQIQSLVPHSGADRGLGGLPGGLPQLELAKTTPQDPIYHAEGDVWTHTQMVVTELLQDGDYAALTTRSARRSFWPRCCTMSPSARPRR